MRRPTQKWFYALLSGSLGAMWGSIDGGLVVLIAAPNEFNFDAKLVKTLWTIGTLGLLAGVKFAVAYLKQSPLPPMEGETEFITKANNSMKLMLLITGILLAVYVKTHAAPPEDSILKQLDTQLKTEGESAQKGTKGTKVSGSLASRIPGRVDEKVPGHFNAGDFDLSLFGQGNIDVRSRSKEDVGYSGGLGGTYWVTRGLGLGGVAALGDFRHSVVDRASGRVSVRAPLWDAIAPYGFADGGYDFEGERWRIETGGGLEVRVAQGWGFFVEAGLGTTTRGESFGVGRAGVRLVVF